MICNLINTATPRVPNKSEAANTLDHKQRQINQFPKAEHNQQMTQTNYIIIQTGILVKKRGQAGTKAKEFRGLNIMFNTQKLRKLSAHFSFLFSIGSQTVVR